MTTSPGRPDAPPTSRGAAVGARLALALIGLSLVLHLPGLVVRLFNSDEASLATMAMVIDHGGHLYRDAGDRKPPAVPYVYAAVGRLTGSRDLRPVRAVAALALAGTAVLLAGEAARRFGSRRAAVYCGVLFLLASAAFFPADSQAAGFEVFMLLPMTAAVLAAARGRALQAGLWLAVACLCKQTAITTALPVAYLLLRSGGWRPAVKAAGAAMAVIAVTAVAFGPSDFLLWTTTGNGGYLALRGSLPDTVLRGLAMTTAFVVANVALVVLAGRATRRRSGGLDLWLWLAGSAFAVLVGFRFFGHYYLQVLPPLSLLAVSALPEARPARRLAVGATAAVAAVATGMAFLPASSRGLLPYGAIADRVKQLTSPRDTIFVWGEFPEIYWAAGREPGTRFIHTGFLTGHTGGRDPGSARPDDGLPGAWALLADDLHAHPPALVVDTTEAGIRGSDRYPLEQTQVWATVRHDYVYLGAVEKVRLYRYVGPGLGGGGSP